MSVGRAIIIFCDMEGISGVYLRSQVSPGGERYDEGRRLMTADVNACVKGCVDGGAERIVVRDVHWGCDNLVWEELDDRARYLVGIPGGHRFEGIEEFDGIILLGYHAMAGTLGAILEHTSSSTWQNCWVNGKKVGEFVLDAARAGERGVPVIMASGDDKLCAEARAFKEDVLTAQVKEGIHLEGAKLLPEKVAHRLIGETSAEAVRNCGGTKPLVVSGPVTVRIEVAERTPFPKPSSNVTVIDGRTREASGKNLAEAIGFFA